ncbi:uncharacterized protein [Ptychodera flava]|uniref:uncharacterized protein isoform X7 n=1 Tax=Ptychodera flava TaxID=63121 RepID=UPI00396A46AB
MLSPERRRLKNHFKQVVLRSRIVSKRRAQEKMKRPLAPPTTASSLTSAPDSQLDDAEDDSNVNVVVRVRPLNSQEKSRSDGVAIEFPGENSIMVEQQGRTKSFTFNAVFEPTASQQDVFDNCGVKRLIEMALDGYAGTTFAYGQTGSGKTHTITGPVSLDEPPNPEMFGLIQRSFQYLFEKIRQNTEESGITYTLSASYLEIYNEQVKDLLNPSEKVSLGVRWSKTKGFYVENLFVVECESQDDVMAVLEEGISHRQTGSNNINEYSSRSHSMLSLFIDSEVPDPDDDTLYITKQGKLSFVDLAGSEKIKELGNTGGELLTETTNINKSLLTLGNCISSLSDPKKKSGYIPYRDSKLTKLLADSLGGNGVTLMIACVSPSSYSLPESMNTLRYANRAKRIKNKPVVRMDPREKLLMSLKREVKLLRSENEYLKGHVHLQKPEKSKESDKGETTPHATTNGHIPNSHNSESDTPIQKPKPKVEKKKRENSTSSISTSLSMKSAADNGLYEMLQEYMIENENLRSENNELVSTRERARREHEFLSKENEKLGKKLEDLERVMATSPLSFARYSFYSRGSSGRSSQPIALASVSSWRAESNTPVSQPPQPDQQVQPLPQQGFTQQQQQQQHPPQPQPQQSLPQQQQQQQYPPNSYPAPGGHPQQPFYQPYSQQQPPPPPPPAQQQQQPQQQPYGQQRISPNNPINRNGPNRQPPPKKQLHELPPVDNMKGVPNTYKSNKQSPFQLQQKNSKNKLLDSSQRNQDPNGSYVDRFQQQQTFNKLYGPEQGTTPRQSKQANISIPPARGLERRDESSSPPDKGPSHSKPAPTHQQSSPKQQHPAANARASDKPHVKGHAERKAKGARGEKGDPSLDAIPPTPTATPPPVKYTPKGTSQMLQSSSLDTAKSSASTGNWSQINDKLRQELQELDGEIEYMKYMNKSQATSAATAPKPAPRTRKR